MSEQWTASMLSHLSKKLGREATRQDLKDHMAEIARKQKGSKKPKSGTGSLTPEERSQRGKEAAKVRWDKARKLKENI